MDHGRVDEAIASIENNTCGSRVDLSNQHLNDGHAVRLAEALLQNRCLTDLNVSGSYFTRQGIRALAQVLPTNQTLRSLNLSVNVADYGGALELSEVLRNNPVLQKLHLNEAGVTTMAASALARALKTNTNLRVLTLDRNTIGHEAANEFMVLLTTNTTLCRLSLPVEPGVAASLRSACDPNRQIEITGTAFTSTSAPRQRSSSQGAPPTSQARPQHKHRWTSSSSTISAPAGSAPSSHQQRQPYPSPSSSSSSFPSRSSPFSPQPPSASSTGGRTSRLSSDHSLIRIVTRERDRLQRELDAKTQEIEALRREKGQQERQRTEVEQAYAELLEEAQQLRSQAEELQGRSKAANKKHDKAMAEAREEARQLRAQMEAVQRVAAAHADALRAAKQNLAEANRDKDQLQQDVDESQRRLHAAQSACHTAEQEAARLRNLFQRAPARVDDAVTQTDTGVTRLSMHHTENALNLSIPWSRFGNVKKARDRAGKFIRANHGALYSATLGGHRVALKQVDVDARPCLEEILCAPSTVGDDEEKRLLREAHVLLSIRHPNIVSFLGLSYDEKHSTLSYVLSWAEGGSLYDRLYVLEDVPTLTEVQRARIAMEVAGAMQFLHAHGVVHRDLKSPNVLLDASLSAKVTDFGLSAFKASDTETLTNQMGTLLWASPEQLMKNTKLYADTDVFSFGVLYWELCFKCKPWHHGIYQGSGASAGTIENKYKAGEYLPLHEEINGNMLSPAQQQLLSGCFGVQGNRLDFTQLHEALRRHYSSARENQQMDEEEQTRMLFGPPDAVWKFPRSLLDAVSGVTEELAARPSVSIAPLRLTRHVDVVQTLLAEAGGPTAQQCELLTARGGTLAAVAITHDKQKQAAFNGALECKKTRYRGHLASASSHPFSPKYEHSSTTGEPTDEEEKQVLRRVTRATAYGLLDPSLLQEDPPVRLQRVFHGVPSWKAVVGILGGDFASLQTRGAWFGVGFYFTPDLDYALRYVKRVPGKLPLELAHLDLGLDETTNYCVVLACDVQYGNPYPVLACRDDESELHPVNQPDAKTFNDKPLMPGHDAHVAVVNMPAPGMDQPVPFPSHSDWATSPGDARPVAEIVISNPSSVAVRALLVFRASTPPQRVQQCATVADDAD